MRTTMTLRDIVLMNFTAIVSLRWLPIAAQYGAASTLMWILAAIFFFLPIGLVSAELASTWPDQGGMYSWIRRAFGEKPAFLSSWFYWLSNVFYFPGVLTANSVVLAFLIDPSLKDSKLFVCGTVLLVFWLFTVFNFRSLEKGKWLSNLSGSFGTLVPGLAIVLLGLLSVFFWKRPIPTDYSWGSWIPRFGGMEGLSQISMLMFAMAGLELTPILAGETENPQRTFPRAAVISALVIVAIYVIGTTALTLILPPAKIGAASGIMDATKLLADELQIPFLVGAMALVILVGNMGGVSVWIVCPIKMLFESTKQGVFPEFVTRLNQEGMPRNALVLQGVFITLMVLLTSLFPSVSAIYQGLLLMTTITYFVPYLLMFAAFIRLRSIHPDVPRPYRLPGGALGAWTVTIIGWGSVVLAIVLSFVPTEPLETRTAFYLRELGIGFGPVVFGLLGYVLFRRFERRERRNPVGVGQSPGGSSSQTRP